MKKHIILKISLALCCCFVINTAINAQAFYSFQSITKHTVFFSLSWQKKIVLGAGYSYRAGGDVKYANLSFEWKAPVDQYFDGKNYEAIAGAYLRHSNGRGGLGSGYHFRLKKMSDEQKEATLAGLAITLLPNYIFAAPLDDDLGGSFGGRLTYIPTIFASVKDKAGDGTTTQKAFAAHTFEGGLHVDFLIRRALGLAVNPVIAKTFTSDTFTLSDTPNWNFQADLYFGHTWLLDRE
ncbi:MAG: hypothetical protein AAF502_08745 [Bacteroidota bacterium]